MPESEKRINISTQTGDFAGITYSNGPKHLHSINPETRKLGYIKQDEFLAERGYKPLTKQEKAREAGEVALDAAAKTPEQTGKQEVRENADIIWHSKAAGKGGNNDLKAKLVGEAERRGDVVYVNIVTDDGTKYKTRLDMVEYLENPAAAQSHEDKQPPAEKSPEEASLDKILDKIEGIDRRLNRLEKGEKLPKDGKKQDAEVADKTNSKKGKEIGAKVDKYSAGEMEISKQLKDGTPVTLRRSKDGDWVYSRNGTTGEEWYPANAELRVKLLGSDPEEMFFGGSKADKEEKKNEEETGTVDDEAMEASMARITAIQAEMAGDPTPERMQELVKELGEENAKMDKTWREGESEAKTEITGEKTEVIAITPEAAKENNKKRFRTKLRDAWFALRGKDVPVVASSTVEDADSGNGRTVITVEDESGPTPPEKKERERRRTIIGGVLGGAAAGAAVAVGFALAKNGHPADVDNFKLIINNFCHNRPSGLHHLHGLHEHLKTHFETLRVHAGNWHDTIWNHVAHRTPAGEDVRQNVQEVLGLNRGNILSAAHQHGYEGNNLWEAARHLPEHFRFKQPNRF